VDVRVQCGLHIRLNAQAVRCALRTAGFAANLPTEHAARRDSLHSVPDAISGSPLSLRVQFADCETDIGRVTDLQVGDVVRLPHGLETPLLVRDTDGCAVFAGFLARQAGFKALELVPLRAADSPPERRSP
jgi:hypothetical protein